MSRTSALTRSEAAPNHPDVVAATAAPSEPTGSRGFDLQSDRWSMEHLLRPHQRRDEGIANFSNLPGWLRPDSKEYAKHLLEEAAADPRAIVNILVSLRHFGRLLPDFNSRPIDLRLKHARELGRRLRRLDLSPLYKNKIKGDINQFMAFVRQKHSEVLDNNFQVVLPKAKIKELQNRRQGQVVDSDTEALIIDGCLSDLQKYREAKSAYIDRRENSAEYYRRWNQMRRQYPPGPMPRPRPVHLQTLHKRAVKGQATILAICVGRRAAAICNLPLDVRVEKGQWTNEASETEHGVWVRFVENKVTRAYENVFCPDAYGELVVKAIETTKELTEDLRRDNPDVAQHLFLVPGPARKSAMVLSPAQMNCYLNGEDGHGHGVIERYDIPCGRVTTHAFRRTRATKAWRGGMQVHEVSTDLGHMNVNIAMRHYIIGNEESRRRYETLMNHGALSGAMMDFVGGVEVVNIELGRRQVEVMARQGRVLRPNRYGYCGLAGTGHCVRTTPCYIGDTVDSEGCEHHVLSPDALPALEEDKEALEASIELNCTGQWCGQLEQSMRNQLTVINRRVERAAALQKTLDVAAGPTSARQHV
jgi:integrase